MTTSQFLLAPHNWSALVLASCIATALGYGAVLRARGMSPSGWFIAALAVIAIAIGSPLDVLAAGYLFSAHMAQHILLLLVAPPLLLAGLRGARPRLDRVPPVIAWLGGVGAMWLWHDATLCDLAARDELARVAQIASLLGLGLVFWAPLVHRLSVLASVGYLVSACIACSVLGILIAFAPSGIVCPVFAHPPDHGAIVDLVRVRWGLAPALDQQLGGLLMWVPGCAIYLIATMAVLARWYRAVEIDAPREP